jgi:epoxide hydrolase 4
VKLHFDSEGDGPLVVLLHGFPEYRQSWREQLPALAAAGFRAVAPDLRGYGESPKPRGVDSYAIREVVDDVAELIESLQSGPCILVGHDWGAFAAWYVAMRHPALVRKLAILNVPHPAIYSRTLRRSAEQKFRSAYQLFFQLPLLPELAMYLYGGLAMRTLGSFSRAEIRDYRRQWRGSLTPMLNYYRAIRRTRGELRRMMTAIAVPVLMIWGEKEPVFLRPSFEESAEWAPDLRFELIPAVGHFVHHDAPERVNELLIEFSRS